MEYLQKNKAIVLIHGFLNSGLSMKYLAKLFKVDYDIYIFEYKSREYSEKTLEDLNNLIKSIKNKEIYLLGHSMGGLIARNYVNRFKIETEKIKSIVTIGTPHNTSECAKLIHKKLPQLLGTAGDSGLISNLEEWQEKIPLGCIAGLYKWKINSNFFVLFNKKNALNDGTVYLDEAILKNCTNSFIINASHTGILLKKEVYEKVNNFFNTHRFE